MQEMQIDSIRVSLMNYQRVVILKERNADRYLPIWIGTPEAEAIAVKLQDVSVPRPLTHDLLRSVISTLGASVQHVVVSDLTGDTFFAKLVVLLPDGTTTDVDCRPSDAIAVAVRGGQFVTGLDGEEHWFASMEEARSFVTEAGYNTSDERNEIRSQVPIFVEERVLDKAGVVMDADLGDGDGGLPPQGQRRGRPAQREVTAEELEKMSAFSEFLQDLPGLEDLGKQSDS